MHLSPPNPVDWVAVRSKVMILLLLNHFNVPLIVYWGSVFGPYFVMHHLVSFLVLQSF